MAVSKHFQPVRIPGSARWTIGLNAKEEQKEIWKKKELILMGALKGLYRKYNLGNTISRLNRYQMTLSNMRGNYGVFNVSYGKWLLKPQNLSTLSEYDAVFDGEKIVPIIREKNRGVGISQFMLINTDYVKFGQPLRNDTILVSDELALLNDSRLFWAVESLNSTTYKIPILTLVQGVPGCGKTSYILKNVKKNDIVLFATREAAQDFRLRYMELYHQDQVNDENNHQQCPFRCRRFRMPKISCRLCYGHIYFRTIDSFLIDENRPEADMVYIDEALMMHLGSILYAADLAGAKEMLLLGDKNQIPYINRLRQCKVMYSDVTKIAKVKEVLNISYRCTVSTAAILSQYYDNGMKSTSEVVFEMQLKRFECAEKIKIGKDVKMLVFKQADKRKMKELDHDVSTVHEYQGKQAKHIVLVRLNTIRERIFESVPHCIVAVSRHTETFTYYTNAENDVITEWVMHANEMTRDELYQYQDFSHNKPVNRDVSFNMS